MPEEVLAVLKKITLKIHDCHTLSKVCPHLRPEMCRRATELVGLAMECCGINERSLKHFEEAMGREALPA